MWLSHATSQTIQDWLPHYINQAVNTKTENEWLSWPIHECTVGCIQHAGAALPTAHSPDGRSQVHPGPSILGSGGCHIWRDTVFWSRTESDGYEAPANTFSSTGAVYQSSLPIRVCARTSAKRETAGWSWGSGWVFGSPWERVEEADEEVEELWTERLIQ